MKEYEYGHPKFYEILEQMAELHNRKNRDYATKENPLGNFTRVGIICEVTEMWKVMKNYPATASAIIYMLKQFDAGIKLLANNQEGKVETFDTRFADVGVYAPLIRLIKADGDIKSALQRTLKAVEERGV